MTNEIEQKQILPMATIKIALNIDEDTLLQYEEQGIVKPERKNNNAYYSLNDFEKIKQAIRSK